MKTKAIILFASLSILMINGAIAQKLIKKMANDACDCINDLRKKSEDQDPNELMDKCLQPTMTKYQDDLRKVYGDKFVDNPDEKAVYDLGVEIGKALINECPDFLDLIIANEEKQNDNSAAIYERAEKLYGEGRQLEAIELYNKVIKIEPENHKYYNSRGVSYFDKGEYYYAISDFINAIRLKSNFALGYYNLAYSKFNLGDFPGALQDVKTAELYAPEHCDTKNLKGLIYNKNNQPDSALLAFSAAYSCDTTIALYAFNTAYLLYSNGKNEEAFLFFNKALGNGYNDLSIYSYMGNCQYNLENYPKAIEIHSLYISKNSEDYVGFYNRGLAYYHLGDYESAILDFKQSAEVDNSDSDIFYKLAQSYEKSGNYTEAEKLYQKAIEMNPDNAEYFDSRAAFYAGIGKYESAIEDSKTSLSLYPEDCQVYLLISKWYAALQQAEKSEEAHNTALELGCEE